MKLTYCSVTSSSLFSYEVLERLGQCDTQPRGRQFGLRVLEIWAILIAMCLEMRQDIVSDGCGKIE